MAAVPDGTSNTLGIVEAKTAVIWTKPDEEIAFDLNANPEQMKALISGLGGHFEGGFNAMMLDGSVRFIQPDDRADGSEALITAERGRSDRRELVLTASSGRRQPMNTPSGERMPRRCGRGVWLSALSGSIVLANPWKQDATAFPSRLMKMLARNPLP